MHVVFSSRRRHTSLTCDWSSDVCSSDLAFAASTSPFHCASQAPPAAVPPAAPLAAPAPLAVLPPPAAPPAAPLAPGLARSEERRVGKECRAPRPAALRN